MDSKLLLLFPSDLETTDLVHSDMISQSTWTRRLRSSLKRCLVESRKVIPFEIPGEKCPPPHARLCRAYIQAAVQHYSSDWSKRHSRHANSQLMPTLSAALGVQYPWRGHVESLWRAWAIAWLSSETLQYLLHYWEYSRMYQLASTVY